MIDYLGTVVGFDSASGLPRVRIDSQGGNGVKAIPLKPHGFLTAAATGSTVAGGTAHTHTLPTHNLAIGDRVALCRAAWDQHAYFIVGYL